MRDDLIGRCASASRSQIKAYRTALVTGYRALDSAVAPCGEALMAGSRPPLLVAVLGATGGRFGFRTRMLKHNNALCQLHATGAPV